MSWDSGKHHNRQLPPPLHRSRRVDALCDARLLRSSASEVAQPLLQHDPRTWTALSPASNGATREPRLAAPQSRCVQNPGASRHIIHSLEGDDPVQRDVASCVTIDLNQYGTGLHARTEWCEAAVLSDFDLASRPVSRTSGISRATTPASCDFRSGRSVAGARANCPKPSPRL